MFINNLETGLKREKETFLGLDYTFNEGRKSFKIQAYFTERAPNMGESINELNTYNYLNLNLNIFT
jgi:hypothetical protein